MSKLMLRTKFSVYIRAISLTLCFLVGSCTLLEKTKRAVVNEYHFEFVPSTILQSIENGEEGIFLTVSDGSDPEPLNTDIVQWDQSDYISILESLHRSVWGESVQDWRIDHMSFSLLCNEVDQGFQRASFSFLQDEITFSENSTIEHQVDIYPRNRLINAWEFAYNSILTRSSTLKLADIMITADEAFTVAENNGGLAHRTAVNNRCEISVILYPNSVNYRGWTILYSTEDFSGTYSITVDPITGDLVE